MLDPYTRDYRRIAPGLGLPMHYHVAHNQEEDTQLHVTHPRPLPPDPQVGVAPLPEL